MVAFEDRGLTPLPVWLPDATADDLRALEAALVQIGRKDSTRLRPAQAGSPGVILAIGSPPPFICRYALVSGIDSPGLANAMKVILTNTPDRRIIDELDMLREIFGPDVREVTDACCNIHAG